MKQELQEKTRRSILRGRNGGQAVVEYILIVSIAVGLIVIMKGAFSGMNTFINNYLGLYTECLMAHGELPVLGVSGSVSFSDGSGLKEHLKETGYKCDTGFKPFTLAGGRPPVDGGSGSTNQASRNGGGKSGSQSESNSANAAGGSSGKNSSKDGNGDKDAVGRNGNGSGSSPYDEGKIKRSGRSSADGFAGAGSDRSRIIEDDGGEGDEEGGRGRKRKPRESRIIYRDRPRARTLLGQEAEQLTSQSSRSTIKRKPTSRAIAKADSGGFAGPRSGLMKQPPVKVARVEERKEEAWGFGKLLKWLLIIGMLVALIIFFGGQLLNYSNSDS